MIVTISIILAVMLGLVWTARLVAMTIGQASQPHLGPASQVLADSPTPKVSLLVAARNEENYIERCIVSLLSQDYPDFEIIAVNDRSTDDTGAILDRLKQEHAHRLTVVHVLDLRKGWKGKQNAIHEGMKRASGDLLFFTDADCQMLSGNALSVAVSAMHEKQADLLTVLPRVEMRKHWEHVLNPVCAAILIVWFLPTRANDPAKKTAYANGAFMLFRRSAYDQIGRHEGSRDALNEDIEFARRIKSEGLRLFVAQNEGLYRTHMYDTLREAWNGWSRIFAGCFLRLGRLSLVTLVLLLFSVLPYVALLVTLSAQPPLGSNGLVMLWIVVVFLVQLAMWVWYRLVGAHAVYSLAYGFGALAALVILGSAFTQLVGLAQTHWRGQAYSHIRKGAS